MTTASSAAELSRIAANLRRTTEDVTFVLDGYVRVKEPDYLITKLEDASLLIASQAKRIKEVEEEIPRRDVQLHAASKLALERGDLLSEAEKVLAPFALIAERDIGDSEHDMDVFAPMQAHNYAPKLTVGDLRRARALLTKIEAPK